MEDYTNMAAEIEIRYRSNVTEGRAKADSPVTVREIMMAVPHFKENIEYREMFYVIYTNSAGKVLNVCRISDGHVDKVGVDIKFIMQGALLQNCTGLIAVHNHPSGNAYPSPADERMTKKLKDACDMFDIALLDHMVLTREKWCSMRKEGLIN